MVLQAWPIAKPIIGMHSDSEPEISHCNRETEVDPHGGSLLQLLGCTWGDCGVAQPETVYKDRRHDSSPKVKRKNLNRPQVAGCSIGQKPPPC